MGYYTLSSHKLGSDHKSIVTCNFFKRVTEKSGSDLILFWFVSRCPIFPTFVLQLKTNQLADQFTSDEFLSSLNYSGCLVCCSLQNSLLLISCSRRLPCGVPVFTKPLIYEQEGHCSGIGQILWKLLAADHLTSQYGYFSITCYLQMHVLIMLLTSGTSFATQLYPMLEYWHPLIS